MKALTHIKIRQIADSTYQITDLIKYNTLTPKLETSIFISVDVP